MCFENAVNQIMVGGLMHGLVMQMWILFLFAHISNAIWQQKLNVSGFTRGWKVSRNSLQHIPFFKRRVDSWLACRWMFGKTFRRLTEIRCWILGRVKLMSRDFRPRRSLVAYVLISKLFSSDFKQFLNFSCDDFIGAPAAGFYCCFRRIVMNNVSYQEPFRNGARASLHVSLKGSKFRTN